MHSTHRVKAIVYDMLEVLAESDLPHELVLVAIHASQLAHMSKGVLQAISKLVSIHIAQPVLDMRVHHQLGESQNLTTQVKGIAKSTFLPFLGGECLDRLEVEVVVQVKVVEILAMDEQVEHVVTLTTHLKTSFHPVQFSGLKELC